MKCRRDDFLSAICPQIAKATDNQWLLSGWQSDILYLQLTDIQILEKGIDRLGTKNAHSI